MDHSFGVTPPWAKGGTRFQLPTLRFSESWEDATPAALTALKNEILPYEEQGHWERLKKMVNPYELVYTPEDPQFHPSLAVIKPLSRSYFKMVELLDTMNWMKCLPKIATQVRTAHVAEGPGGFIQAIVDCLDKHKRALQAATAITLKPTDHRVPGWRRATSFLQRNKQIKLVYGPDGSGDIYKTDNRSAFLASVKPGVHLFTADGGFDFSMNYQIQEEQVFHLLLCSASIGLRCLMLDGCMIIKVFDTYSAPTKILLSLIAKSFTTWALVKPRLSRPCNSERYFVGRGFKGCTPEYLALFDEVLAQSEQKRYPVNAEEVISIEESAYIDQLSSWSTQSQTAALKKALQLAPNPGEWYTRDLPAYFAQALHWCQVYRIPAILRAPVISANPIGPMICSMQTVQTVQTVLTSSSTCLADADQLQPTPGAT